MKRGKMASALICTLAASLILAAGAMTAIAKEERTKIKKVELNITSRIYSGQSTNVGISGGSGYIIEGYEILNMPDDKWSGYDCPRLYITLSADEDYYFTSTGSGYFSLKGDAAKFVKAEKESDGSALWVTVDLKPITGKIGNPTDLEWSSNGVARWDKGYKAKKYEVALYQDDTWKKKETTTSTTYDFSKDMTAEHEYYFKVRSNDGDNVYSDWVESEAFTGTPKSADDGTGTGNGTTADLGPGKWMVNATGWWYQKPDGTYPMNAWENINEIWYYFNGDGYMLTGLQTIGDKLYYLNPDASQAGAMQTGWVQVEDKWYYFGTDGAALVNTTTPDGYQVGADGVMITQ